jgi:hypothetical protein
MLSLKASQGRHRAVAACSKSLYNPSFARAGAFLQAKAAAPPRPTESPNRS